MPRPLLGVSTRIPGYRCPDCGGPCVDVDLNGLGWVQCERCDWTDMEDED